MKKVVLERVPRKKQSPPRDYLKFLDDIIPSSKKEKTKSIMKRPKSSVRSPLEFLSPRTEKSDNRVKF